MEACLQLAAALQLGIALLNLVLVRIMKWKEDLDRLPLLVREVFHVHSWFISLTLAIFAVMTWRFSSEMAAATDPASNWLAAGIGIFWLVRVLLQLGYYSSSHWRGHTFRTLLHVGCLLVYGGLSAVYLLAAI